jgi:hypothetical protein
MSLVSTILAMAIGLKSDLNPMFLSFLTLCQVAARLYATAATILRALLPHRHCLILCTGSGSSLFFFNDILLECVF